MFGTDEDHRQGRIVSAQQAAEPRRKAGSLLLDAGSGMPEEDAVSRHSRARARHERRSSPLLEPAAGSSPLDAETMDEPADILPPAAEVRQERSTAAFPKKIIGLTLAGALAGTALAFAWPQTYAATSEVVVAPDEAALALVDNQMSMLRSGTMLNAAAERLNLAADAEFNGSGGGMLAGLTDLFAGDPAASAEQRRRRAVEALSDAIKVERAGASSVLSVTASTADPQKSALIANTIMELFVERTGRPDSGSERLAELRSAVAEAERAIEAYKAQNELVDAEGRLITDDEIMRLGEQLSAARARTVELNARAASTREADVDSIVTGSLPEQYASPALADLRLRYAAAKQQLDRLSARLGPRHPDRLSAQAEMEGAREEISAELRRVASSLQTELKRAVQQEQELAGELARMKVRQGDIGGELVQLRELERDAELKRSAYDRAMHAAQAGVPAPGAASIISRAEPPLDAAGPSVPAFSLAGALAGLLAGLGLSGWRRQEPEQSADEETADQGYAEAETAHAGDENIASSETGKEADVMYPYPHAAQYPVQEQTPATGPYYAHPQQQSHMQPAPAMPMQAAPAAPVGYPQQMASMPQQPMAIPQQQWPAAPYPAPAHNPYWAAQPQQPMMPPPYDPWAHYRQAPAYAPPMQTVVYVPAPPHAEPAFQPVAQAAPQRRPAEERWHGQDAFVDERTNAAIEEIRQSLREFREAIEDFADERDRRGSHRRYGT